MPCDKKPLRKGEARDPLAFLSCHANPAPQTCLSSELAAASSGPDSEELAGEAGVGGGGCGSSGGGGGGGGQCLNAAREAASLVANSLNLPPRLHARTVEAAVAEAAAAEDEDNDSMRNKGQPSVGSKHSVWILSTKQ